LTYCAFERRGGGGYGVCEASSSAVAVG
jgi:hypothetical protein